MKFNFLSPKNKISESGKDEEKKEKKIEFSGKLSTEDQEDLLAEAPKKSKGFDFLPDQKKDAKPGESEPSFTPSSGPAFEERAQRKKFAPADLPTSGPASEGKSEVAPEKKKKGFAFNPFKRGKEEKAKEEKLDIIDVDLVRGEIVKFFDWQRNVLILLISIFLSLAVLAGVYWGISWWGSNIEYAGDPNLAQNYYKLDKQIKELDDEVNEVLRFRDRLETVDTLLSEHTYWTNLFSFLEENTLTNVYFSGFSGDLSGQYSLSAHSDDFNAIDAQVKKFLAHEYVRNAQVTSGSISSGDGGSASISFTIKLSLNPDIFLK